MIVQHNLSAMNTNRQVGIVNNAQAKSTEKLSSGYRINRAADDAAGLAISEKMRRQIRGLTQASANCQDGISLVQVADGALGEMTEIMQRMNELSVKAANGTLQVDDREAIQSEINALTEELRRIQNATTFNEIPLFNGEKFVGIDSEDYGNAKFGDKLTLSTGQTAYGKAIDFGKIDSKNKDELAGKSFKVHCSAGCAQTFTFSFAKGGGSDINVTGRDLSVVVDVDEVNDGADIAKKIYDLAASKQGLGAGQVGQTDNSIYNVYIGHANAVDADGAKLNFFGAYGAGVGYIEADELDDSVRNLDIQAGSEAGQIIPVKLYNIGPAKLGVSRVDVATQQGAKDAIDAVKGGIIKLNEYRSYYGAVQNRMEHTIKNLDNIVENTTAAESQIRDTDMATEMVRYSNNNILLQAGTSMLAQANQSNQNVLSLLS